MNTIYAEYNMYHNSIDIYTIFIVSGTIVFSFSALEELLHIFWWKKNISVPFLCQQEVTNIAVFDSISAHIQFIHRYNVFREIVTNTGKRPKLTLDGFLRGK